MTTKDGFTWLTGAASNIDLTSRHRFSLSLSLSTYVQLYSILYSHGNQVVERFHQRNGHPVVRCCAAGKQEQPPHSEDGSVVLRITHDAVGELGAPRWVSVEFVAVAHSDDSDPVPNKHVEHLAHCQQSERDEDGRQVGESDDTKAKVRVVPECEGNNLHNLEHGHALENELGLLALLGPKPLSEASDTLGHMAHCRIEESLEGEKPCGHYERLRW